MVRPEFWGPGTWNLLYSIVFDVENKEKTDEDFIDLLKILENLLPCEECRQHYREYMIKNPPGLKDMKVWLNTFHNSVNDRLKKPRVHISIMDKKVNFVAQKKTPQAYRKRVNIVQTKFYPVTGSVTSRTVVNNNISTSATQSVSTRASIKSSTKTVAATVTKPNVARNVTTVSKLPIVTKSKASFQVASSSRDLPQKKGCGCGGKK